MTHRLAWQLLMLQVFLLLVGTLMPGVWRTGIESTLNAPTSLASWAHLGIFAGMAWVAAARPLAWSGQRVLLAALALALATEGLQFFALERHPRWRDVGIDLGGAGLGLLLVYFSGRKASCCSPR